MGRIGFVSFRHTDKREKKGGDLSHRLIGREALLNVRRQSTLSRGLEPPALDAELAAGVGPGGFFFKPSAMGQFG